MSEDSELPAGQAPSDVYAEWQLLRESQPVSKSEEGLWRVARYDDVRQVLKNHADFSSDVAQKLEGSEDDAPTMLFSDPPDAVRRA